jgi:hypothetical protein
MQHSFHRACAAAAAAAVLLAACGGGEDGGGGSGGNGGSEVPASALASVPGLIAYMQALIAGTSDTARPVILGDVVLPVDDTSAPTPLR